MEHRNPESQVRRFLEECSCTHCVHRRYRSLLASPAHARDWNKNGPKTTITRCQFLRVRKRSDKCLAWSSWGNRSWLMVSMERHQCSADELSPHTYFTPWWVESSLWPVCTSTSSPIPPPAHESSGLILSLLRFTGKPMAFRPCLHWQVSLPVLGQGTEGACGSMCPRHTPHTSIYY